MCNFERRLSGNRCERNWTWNWKIRRQSSLVKLPGTELVKIPSNRRKISCVAKIGNQGGKTLDCVTSYSGEFTNDVDQTQRNRSRGPHARTTWSVMRVMKDGLPLSDVEQTSTDAAIWDGYILFAQEEFEKISSVHVRDRVNDDFGRTTEFRSLNSRMFYDRKNQGQWC